MIVKFIRSRTPYMAGEMAGFPDAQAKALISSGVAVAYGSQPEPEPTALVSDAGPEIVKVEAFDPLTADVPSLKAYLTANGVSFHHKTGEAKLRELALDVATKG